MGDVVEVVTNGHLKATKYRVVPRKGERAAIEFAARLDPEVQVKPHPMFIEEGGKVMPSVTQLELMSILVPGLSSLLQQVDRGLCVCVYYCST